MRSVVVTGAGGFVGRPLVCRLVAEGYRVVPVVRRAQDGKAGPGGGSDGAAAAPGAEAVAGRPDGPQPARVAALEDEAAWPEILAGADALVHLAAHNPQRGSRAAEDVDAFRRVNVEATARLAEAARAAGLTRFVFVSSVRVYGPGGERAFTEEMAPAPADPYGLSKHDGESAIVKALEGGPTAWTILRPPVVYGPGRGGVLGALARAVRFGVPLPFGRVRARRSVIYVGNLVDAIVTCLDDPRAERRIFNVSDGAPVTYRELMAMMAAGGGSARALPVPGIVLAGLGRLPRLGPAFDHALRPCVVDDTAIRAFLGWLPPHSTGEGIALSFGRGAGRPADRPGRRRRFSLW